ncbi:ribonuclease III [Jonesiaceae bacterium BS-20]|uniref:Ribonuclease 3 n=1 Tax=Jonesiaceae bacterium BS-20 TaxID=3120821 RepID=A0AAU7DS33_9MICO
MTSKKTRKSAPASELLKKLGVHLDPELLVLSLTHRSFAHEAGGLPTNERLEFLGDAVLGMVTAETLYHEFPDKPEGDLAKMRAATVSQKALAAIARTLDLGDFVLLGRGESRSGGNDKDSILSDTVEALIGAVFLTHGMAVARDFVQDLIGDTLAQAANLGAALDWKTSLQELCSQLGFATPQYVNTPSGPDHARIFASQAIVQEQVVGTGTGTAKKHAELEAAEQGYQTLRKQYEKELKALES